MQIRATGVLAALVITLTATPPAEVSAQEPPRGSGRADAGADGSPRQDAASTSSADDRLLALLDEDLEALMARHPLWASVRGDRRFDDRLTDPSPEAEAAWTDAARMRLERLRRLDLTTLSPRSRIDADLLEYELLRRLASARFREWLTPVTLIEGPHQWLPQLPGRLSFTSRAQLEAFAARLEAVRGHAGQLMINMRRGVAEGVTPPRLVVGALVEKYRALARGAPDEHLLFSPLARLPGDDPLRARGLAAVQQVTRTLGAFADFIEREYLPACRDSIAAIERPDGVEFYAHCLAEHTTLSLGADDVHALGLTEVARIKAEMLEVIGRAGVDIDASLEGDARLRAFVEQLRGDPRNFCRSAEELLARYRDVAKRVDPELPRLFGRLPRNTYGVQAMPELLARSAPTAYYLHGSLENGTPGWFVANTSALDQRPIYEVVPLTLHEAVPGHHLQVALAQELTDVHPWRTLLSYTAFAEGWGVYAERLGLEMGPPGSRGLYARPIDDFGRLSFEMWRALRLVVDTGLHTRGWSRQQAIEYMLANSALAAANVEREVDRYVAWPGQGVAYKLGELKLRELRARAEAALGERFDLRAFHDAVLGEGAVPLGVLERLVERWIDDARRDAASAAAPHSHGAPR
ncbi:MAG: DUF885 domain-containing protein [Planctomycetes bacterium]|nr:DUF885 domain-containing protein [Planctomycetota bacterium]